MPEPPRRVVIIGGGFAGADVAQSLGKRLPREWEVVLFSRENHMVFTPLLAEVVGASIDPRHVVWPVRDMAPRALCRTVPVRAIDLEQREVVYTTHAGSEVREPWDHLVLACGLAVNLHLVPGMAEHAWPLKTLGDALALRNHLIQQLERAETEPDAAHRAHLLSFAIVGGGFTGVELAGAIMDLLIDATPSYSRFDRDDLRMTIVEGGQRILGPLPESLSRYAERELRAQGVDIRTACRVEAVRADGVQLGDGERVPSGTTITAVGNTVQPLLSDTPLAMERGRLVVSAEMLVAGRADVWALGDCAAVPNSYDDSISPTLGQFAARQADQLGRNIAAVVAGREPEPFRYHMRGMVAAIGHHRAVGNPLGISVSGFPAFCFWRAIYWGKMPSLARRVQIAFDWFWDLWFPRDIVEISTLRTGLPVESEDAQLPD